MQRPLFAALAAFVALVLGNAGDLPTEEVLHDCFDEAGCASQIEAMLEDEVQELRTELLQTKLELKKTDAPEMDTLHELRAETMAAETASREATKRMVDSTEAQARSDQALAYHPVAKKHNGSKEASAAKHKHHGGGNKLLAEAMIPAGALIAGGLLMIAQQTMAGLLAIYFGAQAGFSLYMKVILSSTVISEELGINGIPAGFLVTSIQQVVAFAAMIVIVGALWWTPWRYTPRKLNDWKEVACVLLFSSAFALNIGLNNYSLSLLALSMNMIIRSCLPLVTLVLNQLMAPCLPQDDGKKVGVTDVVLMVAGVFFAGLATLAKSEGSSHGSSESKHLVLGVFMCSLSDIAAALNLILAGVFGSYLQPKLNPMDTIFYMAVPCGLFLLPASLLVLHPVDWPGVGQITDFQVYDKVMELSPETMGWVVLSGFIALGYNVLQYTVVQKLSAEHAAFAGNFNKAATIMISICMGLESLPGGVWSVVMLLAILGNIGSFTGFSLLKSGKPATSDSAEKAAAGDSAAKS